MAGIYIHIPFCKKACHYCNFHFSTTHSLLDSMIDAMAKEIKQRSNYLTETVNTIYFGGGTPSICNEAQLSYLFETLNLYYQIHPDSEISLEANPDDISVEKLLLWKKLGINRLSIGVQSFIENDLVWMNRAHNAAQSIKSISLAKELGFENISIDLIYGTPTLTDEQWQQNVQQAIALQIPHLSCYALTVEPQTALKKMIEKGKIEAPQNEKQATHFEMLIQLLNEAGYEHYEISNFSLPNQRSKHNNNYWKGIPYIGIGPSAHSFDGISRQWNIANNALYIQAVNQNISYFERELLQPKDVLNENIMTSLRTLEGIDLSFIHLKWGEAIANAIILKANEHINKGLAEMDKHYFFLNNKGKLFADGIASDLFFD